LLGNASRGLGSGLDRIALRLLMFLTLLLLELLFAATVAVEVIC
jgi:hypothetical protein